MYLKDPRDFGDLLADISASGVFGLDTEFIRERTFRPDLCLLQIALPDRCVIVDPQEVTDLSDLTRVLEDPAVEKVVHAGQQDMEIFFAGTGRVPRNVFDTQVAGALLGHGDQPAYHRLVGDILGTRLKKGHTFTDWARRPLSSRQIEYALDDVRYLLPLREKLARNLLELGRMEWLREEVRTYEDPESYRRDPLTMYRRVSGAQRLSREELAVLRELAAFREEEAERRNLPRGRIMNDTSLVELARLAPRATGEIDQVRGVHPQLVRRSGSEILRRVERGRKSPPVELRRPPRKSDRDNRSTQLVDLAEVVLRVQAEAHQIAASMIGSRADLHELVERLLSGSLDAAKPDHSPLLRGWRRNLVGNDVLKLLRGDSSLRFDPVTERVIVEDRCS